MAVFAYKGRAGGRIVADEIEADSRPAAVAALRAKGIVATAVKEKQGKAAPAAAGSATATATGSKKLGGKVKDKQLAIYTRQFSTMIDAGLAVSPVRYDEARTLARRCRAMLGEAFGDVDVLIAPSTMGEAPAGTHATGDPLFNRIWTLLHVPVVHVPLSSGPRGLPLGVTVVGPIAGDHATLLAADWLHIRLGEGNMMVVGAPKP